MSDSDSVPETLFPRFLSTQRYKIHPCALDIHRVDPPGTFRLNVRFLHNQMSNFNSVNGTLFAEFLATQWYKVHPYVMDVHGVRFCYGSIVQLVAGKNKSSTVRLIRARLGEELFVLVI